jgi:hypothetical protein
MAKKRDHIGISFKMDGSGIDYGPGKVQVAWTACIDTDPTFKMHGNLDVDVPGTAATGTITCVAGSALIDGETVTVDDGVNPPTVFEFDSDSSVSGSNVPVVFDPGDSAAAVRDALVTAIDGVGATLYINADTGAAADADLTADFNGTYANQTITHTVVDAGFAVAGMSGGTTGTWESMMADIITAVNTAVGI